MDGTMKTKKLNSERYGKLLAEINPRVIRNDRDLDRLTAVLLALDERSRPTPEEYELAELLTLLIEQYEERNHEIPKATPLDVLRFLMEQHGFTAKDLWPAIGSKGVTSEILSGRRAISVSRAAELGKLFHVGPGVFVDWNAERKAKAS